MGAGGRWAGAGSSGGFLAQELWVRDFVVETPLRGDSDSGAKTQLALCRVTEQQLAHSSCSKVFKFELILFSSPRR